MEFADHNKQVCFVISDKKKKDLFISIFSLLKSASSQINLTVNKESFHIQGMEKSHVCMFDLKLSSEWFNYFKVDTKYNLCFDTNMFYSMMSIKSEEQAFVFMLDDEKSESLSIELKNSPLFKSDKSEFNKFFKLPLNEYEYEEMIVPNVDYDVEFVLSAKKVTDTLSQLHNFGDDLNIFCSSDYVDFKTSSNSVEMRVNINVDNMTSYAIVENEEINLNYSLVYISKMCISNKLSNDIEFCLSNEYPMKINYDLGHNSSLIFYIAPKLADD
jgi:proliferating cell nuclear antigen